MAQPGSAMAWVAGARERGGGFGMKHDLRQTVQAVQVGRGAQADALRIGQAAFESRHRLGHVGARSGSRQRRGQPPTPRPG
jgi:hypothetical protein